MNIRSLTSTDSTANVPWQGSDKCKKVTQHGIKNFDVGCMKHLRNSSLLGNRCATLLSAAFCVAGITVPSLSSADTQDIIKSNNQLSVSATDRQIDYTEFGNGQFNTPMRVLDTEAGQMSGLKLSVTSMGARNNGAAHHFVKLSVSRSDDMVTYTGSSLIAVSGQGYGINKFVHYDSIENVDAAYGIGFDVNDNLMISSMIEVGYRSWNRSVDAGEFYTHRYYAGGLLIQYSPIDKAVFSASATAGKTFAANIDVTPIPGLGGFSGALGGAPIQKYSLSADYGFQEHFRGHLGLDITHFSYGISDTQLTSGGWLMWEPNSVTIETIVNIGLGYAF